ncbi:hypothetical protein CL619_02675 [archaeon]|nr:hypothetical protein [archaeon]
MHGALTGMEEHIFEGREELKRVEHIIYVSLKYTRTTDVVNNALVRLVSFYDFMVEGYLIDALEKGNISRIAKSPALRAKDLGKLHSDDPKFQQHLGFYFFMRELLKRDDFNRINEYRRHVGKVYSNKDNTVIINIDTLEAMEWYAHQFFQYSLILLGLKKEEEY